MASNTEQPDLTEDYIDQHVVSEEPKDDYAEFGREVCKLAMKLAKDAIRDFPKENRKEVLIAIPFIVKSVPAAESKFNADCCFILTPDGTGIHIPC